MEIKTALTSVIVNPTDSEKSPSPLLPAIEVSPEPVKHEGRKVVKKLGRPPGKSNSTLDELNKERIQQIENQSRAYIIRKLNSVVKAVTNKAIQGDLVAAKIILDRVLPVRKAVEHFGKDTSFGINIVVQTTDKREEKIYEGEVCS